MNIKLQMNTTSVEGCKAARGSDTSLPEEHLRISPESSGGEAEKIRRRGLTAGYLYFCIADAEPYPRMKPGGG
jgi:hypothetical protein